VISSAKIRDLRFERAYLRFVQSFPHFEGQIQAGKILGYGVLEQFNDAQTLAVVLEAAVLAHAFRQRISSPECPEGRMTEIVRESDGLGQILIQAQGPARWWRTDRGDLNRVSQSCAQMVPGAVEKNLRFVFQTTKSAGK